MSTSCMKPCLVYGRLSFFSCPTSFPLFVSLLPSLPPSLRPSLPPSLPLSLSIPLPFILPPPPTQGDEPLNSDDDDEDSDGEGTHFDTEDNIVCQFEKVRCSIVVINVRVTVSAALPHPRVLLNIKTCNVGENGVSPHVSMAWSANGQNEKSLHSTHGVYITVILAS